MAKYTQKKRNQFCSFSKRNLGTTCHHTSLTISETIYIPQRLRIMQKGLYNQALLRYEKPKKRKNKGYILHKLIKFSSCLWSIA